MSDKSVDECWHGHRPVQTVIRQSATTIPSIGENWDSVPEDAAAQMADMVADHDLLQSSMKEEVTRDMESRFAALTVEGDAATAADESHEGEEWKQDTLVCIFDIPGEHEHEVLYLLRFCGKEASIRDWRCPKVLR
ncbi:hypothetical protein ACJZ2D_006476 [Fusarium nematophilum]